MEGGTPKILWSGQGGHFEIFVSASEDPQPPPPDVNSVTSLNYEDIVPRTQNNILKPPWPLFYLVCKMENVTTFLRFHRQIAR